MEAAFFIEAIRDVSRELQPGPGSPARLNQAAARIDHLGRHLYGLGWVRDHEIGRCLTAAVSELDRARGLPEADRAESVRQAILQLEAALRNTEEGLRPDF